MTDNGEVSTPLPAPAAPIASGSAAGRAVSSSRVTREDVVRAGRGGSPWEFVPLALGALRVLSTDVEIRFLLAAAYAKLMLRTAALEQLELVPEEARQNTGVVALAEAVRTLPDDRVELRTLERTLAANLARLSARGEHSVGRDGHMESWRVRGAARDWFRTRSGDLVWRATGDAGGWMRFDAQREQAEAIRLPHDEHPAAATYPTWYAVDGIDPPWMLQRLWRSTGNRNDGFAPLVLAMQRDPLQALDGLAQHDLAEVIGDPRVRFFIGEDAGGCVQRFLEDRARAGVRIACAAVGLPTTSARIAPSIADMVANATRPIEKLQEDVRRHLDADDRPRTREQWAARFRAARRGEDDALRVLIPTSRFSTFLRHSAADLVEALNGAGCRANLFVEPDAHSLLEPLATLRMCEEFRPDLIVIPNYTRANISARVPAHTPFVTWVQDAMPHLFEKGAGARLGELDFIAGNLQESMFQHLGYPRSRALSAPMAASATKFHPGPVSDVQRVRHACEIAYVSHHSETPAAMHARRRAEAGASPHVVALLDALFDRVTAIAASPIARGPLATLLRQATLEEVRRAGLPEDEPSIAGALTAYVLPIADRALRHRTLDWAATIAERRGWRMHLYGKGWEHHSTLAAHSRGELAHGDDLRACYQTARAHLHISLHTAVHQRVFECAMSGGLPLCRLQADDLSQLEYLAAATACRAGEPDAIDPDRRSADGYRYGGYAMDSCDAARRYGEFLRAMGLPVPEHVWLNQIHAERLRSSAAERIDGEEQALWNLWPDPAALMFHDEGTLERVLARAIEDDAWRARQSRALGDHARACVSYDALARKLLEFVESRLANGSPADPPRWYDNRASACSRRPTSQH